ncbi:hypothetical protein [Enterocloster clostridioformis]|uniref:hypothetical protein n=1 Tax=Enterocloster clostridioformis TaxID=1531 RepID=UPI0012D73C05|nr:hypothetical protein [Enterocloster clostridioformis]MCA5577734.1 hypothetical protein [Enterocloster clostridioformis]MDU1962638.1 hypothetical protein [Enterocloster clostridioformis]
MRKPFPVFTKQLGRAKPAFAGKPMLHAFGFKGTFKRPDSVFKRNIPSRSE